VNSGVDLAEALMKDASLRVLVLNGYYDLATPFSATEYVMTHLGVPPAVGARAAAPAGTVSRRTARSSPARCGHRRD